MPTKNYLAVPITNIAACRTLLPFLYCTSTLRILGEDTKWYRLAPRRVTTPQRNIATTARETNPPPRQWDIPFEPSDNGHHHVSLNTGQSHPVKPTTMTTTEQTIFDRIFMDLSQSSLRKQTTEDAIHDEPERLNEPYEDLNAIFEAAIKETKMQENRILESARRSQIYYSHLPFRRAIGDQDPTKNRDQSLPLTGRINSSYVRPLKFRDGTLRDLYPIGPSEEPNEQLKKACDEHRSLVENALECTTTDAEIWDVLEKEVFNLVSQLDRETAYRKEIDTATEKKQKVSLKREASRAKKSSPTPKVLPAATDPKALTTTSLLSILQMNYAYYNLCALRLWRQRHPSIPYALHLLTHIKSLGSISYVLGISAGLYNEILFVKWTHFNDLHGVADLLEEMSNQGVESNRVTLEFLKFIDNTRAKDLAGKRGSIIQKWWDLRAVKEGWVRVHNFYHDIRENFHRNESMEMEGQEQRKNKASKSEHVERQEDPFIERHEHTEVDRHLSRAGDGSLPSSSAQRNL